VKKQTPAQRLAAIAALIERVENRCMAADGPVSNTRAEMTDAEMRKIWLLARTPPKPKKKPDPKTLGLFHKFDVSRVDGSSEPGGKHEHCNYFVLDINCDPYAVSALLKYAYSCKAEYPLLADELVKLAQHHCEHEWTETTRGPNTVGEHCYICGVDRDYSDPE